MFVCLWLMVGWFFFPHQPILNLVEIQFSYHHVVSNISALASTTSTMTMTTISITIAGLEAQDTSWAISMSSYLLFSFFLIIHYLKLEWTMTTTTTTNGHLNASIDYQNGLHLTSTCPTTPSSHLNVSSHGGGRVAAAGAWDATCLEPPGFFFTAHHTW